MNRSLLYVDDEIDNIVVFQAAFEDDFDVLTAESGQEALELLQRHPLPVVIADQRMPGMTGVQLFEVMRQQFPRTKRILLTGYTDPDAMADAINRGRVFHFVKKPWERSFLFSVIVRAFDAYELEMANSALTNRLVTAQRSAMLGQATARITHEMSNQLCMLPMIEMIEENYAHDRDLSQVARFARETHERLVSLVEEVKNFMRFEQEDFAKHPIPLNEVVHELVSFLRFDKTFPHDALKLDLRDEPLVMANKSKLQQVLINLVKNAVDAIADRPDGRILLRLAAEETEALLSVIDNGCGMTAEVLERIWEPFFTTKGDEGNGLGLDVSRRLIEGHGGSITCRSSPRKGTTFNIRLPRIEPGRDQPSPEGRDAGDERPGPDADDQRRAVGVPTLSGSSAE